ncbi:Uncharacterised protein [uncultured archaeon]|nr:Uncharacterised protein [uncultured archaeon]
MLQIFRTERLKDITTQANDVEACSFTRTELERRLLIATICATCAVPLHDCLQRIVQNQL